MNASRASGSPSFLLRAGAFALAGLLLAGCGGDKPAEGGEEAGVAQDHARGSQHLDLRLAR